MSVGVKRLRGVVIHRAILIGNTSTPLTAAERIGAPPDHTHKWTVAVRSAASFPLPTIAEADQLGLPSVVSAQTDAAGASSSVPNANGAHAAAGAAAGAASAAAASGMSTRGRDYETDYHKMVGGKDDISHFIKRVQFKLHETYPQSTRNIDKPPFQVTETGWGEFDIQIKIFFVAESGEKPISTFHRLKLHPWHPIALPAPDAGLDAPDGAGLVQEEAAPTLSLENGEGAMLNGDADGKEDDEEEEQQKPAEDVTMDGVEEENTSSNVKTDDAATSSTPVVHETRSASAAAVPNAQTRNMPAVVHSWSYDEIVFPEPIESFYEILTQHIPSPLPVQSAQAFSEPSTFRRYKNALAQLNESSGPQGRDIHAESGILPPHPLHDSSGAVFDALSQEAILSEGERLDMARRNAVQELEETRIKLIEGENKLRQGRPRLAA